MVQLASHRSEGLRVLIGFLLDFWSAANASGIRYSRGYFRFWSISDLATDAGCVRCWRESGPKRDCAVTVAFDPNSVKTPRVRVPSSIRADEKDLPEVLRLEHVLRDFHVLDLVEIFGSISG